MTIIQQVRQVEDTPPPGKLDERFLSSSVHDSLLHAISPASTSGGAAFSPITLPPEQSFDAGEIDENPPAWKSVASSKRSNSWVNSKPDLVIRNKLSLDEIRKKIANWPGNGGDQTEMKNDILIIYKHVQIKEIDKNTYFVFGLTGESYALREIRRWLVREFMG